VILLHDARSAGSNAADLRYGCRQRAATTRRNGDTAMDSDAGLLARASRYTFRARIRRAAQVLDAFSTSLG
jgi:hypothetical protein